MKERPILFSGPMVKAIITGRKTQTRRVVKPPAKLLYVPTDDGIDILYATGEIRCPHGEPGDRLWVRETFLTVGGNDPKLCRVAYRATNEGPDEWVSPAWKPSIFMPRWASRITLEITDVGIERIQDISIEDCLREAVDESDTVDRSDGTWMLAHFKKLWDSINSKHGFGWDENPWAWVISFRKVEPESR